MSARHREQDGPDELSDSCVILSNILVFNDALPFSLETPKHTEINIKHLRVGDRDVEVMRPLFSQCLL